MRHYWKFYHHQQLTTNNQHHSQHPTTNNYQPTAAHGAHGALADAGIVLDQIERLAHVVDPLQDVFPPGRWRDWVLGKLARSLQRTVGNQMRLIMTTRVCDACGLSRTIVLMAVKDVISKAIPAATMHSVATQA